MQLSIYCEIATAIFVEIGEESPYSAECFRILVGTSGLEPPTSRLSGVCSNQLSYVPIILSQSVSRLRPRLQRMLLVEVSGIEPLTPCLQGRCSPS